MRAVLGFLLSAALHVGLLASAYIYFPQAASRFRDQVIVPVDLVELGPETNVRAARPEPEPEPEEEEEPEPEPEPVEEEAEPEPEPEPVEPEPIPPEPEAEEEPEPEPEPVEEEPEPEPEPAPEPEPEPVEEEPQGLDLDQLSSLVDRAREESASRPTEVEEGEARRGAGLGTDMTATLQTMFASQIARCVRSNADAPADMDLVVRVEVRLERNGELAEPPRLVNEARVMNSSNRYLRVAGERAIRAVIECAPYQLPPEAYQEWRLLEVNVDTQ